MMTTTLTTLVTRSGSTFHIRKTSDARFFLTGKSLSKDWVDFTNTEIDDPYVWPIRVGDRPTFQIRGGPVGRYGTFTLSAVESVVTVDA